LPATHTDSSSSEPKTTTAERIISAARDEFVKYGFSGARVDRIARSAGVNKAMIYYHYHSKENLYQMVIEDSLKYALERLAGKLSEAASIESVLREVVTMHTHLFVDAPGFRAMILREAANPTSELLDRLAATLVNTGVPAELRNRLESGIALNTLRPIDIRQAVAAFISMSIGYFLVAPITERIFHITDTGKFIEDRKQVVVDIFLNGINAR
jgi:TetR/AcrR family transcriptional regulator